MNLRKLPCLVALADALQSILSGHPIGPPLAKRRGVAMDVGILACGAVAGTIAR